LNLTQKRFPSDFIHFGITSRYRRREQWLAPISRSLPASDLGVRRTAQRRLAKRNS
jgi:hypothetical protein